MRISFLSTIQTRDNLGSALLYENAAIDCYENSYSPWGVRTYRVGNNTYFYQPGEEPGYGPFYRTYTGHEDLWMFGLLARRALIINEVSPKGQFKKNRGTLLFIIKNEDYEKIYSIFRLQTPRIYAEHFWGGGCSFATASMSKNSLILAGNTIIRKMIEIFDLFIS